MSKSDLPEEDEEARRPSEKLGELIAGGRITQLVYVAAKLGVADALAEGPKTAEQLAAAIGANPRALYRLMRALASQDIFVQRNDGRFQLEDHSELLRSDVPGSLRPSAVMAGEPWFYGPYGHLVHTVRTGQTAFDHLFGSGLFEYLGEHPEESQLFNESMTGFSQLAEVVEAYDFTGISRVVDVGGGQGVLIAAILKAYPSMKGTLFDQAEVLKGALEILAKAGVEDRCELVSGDFFEFVPTGGDAYMMKWIIHDWDDRRSIAILKNCRDAIAAGTRLLLIEREMRADNEPDPTTLGDITMMVIPGGQERTRGEYESILSAAGFRLANVYPTRAELSIFEALAV